MWLPKISKLAAASSAKDSVSRPGPEAVVGSFGSASNAPMSIANTVWGSARCRSSFESP